VVADTTSPFNALSLACSPFASGNFLQGRIPLEMATTMFAWSRLSTATVSRSWTPAAPPPRLMFATSKPSA